MEILIRRHRLLFFFFWDIALVEHLLLQQNHPTLVERALLAAKGLVRVARSA